MSFFVFLKHAVIKTYCLGLSKIFKTNFLKLHKILCNFSERQANMLQKEPCQETVSVKEQTNAERTVEQVIYDAYEPVNFVTNIVRHE